MRNIPISLDRGIEHQGHGLQTPVCLIIREGEGIIGVGRIVTPGKHWLDFLNFVSGTAGGGFVFRGEADSSNPGLRPSIYRPRLWHPGKYDSSRESQMFERFRQEAPRFNVKFDHPLEWMALAQHHGLPTRLLDWSFNPLVAAWFALGGDHQFAENGKIHVIEYNRASDVKLLADPFSSAVTLPILVEVPAKAARVTAQMGLFSLHPDDKPWTPSHFLSYTTLDVPASEKPYFKRMLHRFGVDQSRLMGDLDGYCATLSWDMRTR